MKTPQLTNDSHHFGRKWLVCGKVKHRLEGVSDPQQPIAPLLPPSASVRGKVGELMGKVERKEAGRSF